MKSVQTGPKRIVVASIFGMAFGYSAIGVASFGVFVVPLTERFGWGRGDMSLALTIMSIAIVFLSPVAGGLIDRFGVRRVLIPSTAAFGIVIGSMALLTGSLWNFFAMYLLIAVAGVCTSPASYSRIIVAWFDARRGLALGISLAGIGLGTAFIPPYVAWLTAEFGWRIAYVGLGLAILCVSWPAVIAWIQRPEDTRTAGDPAVAEAGFGFADAIRSRPFFLLVASFVLLGIYTAGILAHLVPLLNDRGVPLETAARVASVLGVALILGRLLTGYLLDRLFAPVVVVTFLLGPVIGIALLLGGATGAVAIFGVVLIGLGLGAEMDFMSYLVSRYFGLRSFGRIYGLTYSALTVGLSLGPIIMGYSQQYSGSYDLALKALLAISIAAILPFLLLGPYPVLPNATENLEEREAKTA